MDKLRKMAQGRLSEYLGATTLGLDKFIRTMGIHYAGKLAYEDMKEKAEFKLVSAYTAGVNECKKWSYFQPMEYYALWVTMEAWS